MKNYRARVTLAVLAMLLLIPTPSLHAADSGTAYEQPVLEGYSPVSYYEQGQPERGSRDYRSRYQGNLYWFTNKAQKQTFDANPAVYAPIFPKHCPYNLATGREVGVDPTNFKIVDGQLLLFHRSTDQNGRKLWEETINRSKITEKELLRRAEINFIKLNF